MNEIVWYSAGTDCKSAPAREENSVVELENHELNEQLMLINQLDEDEKNALIKIINSMLTKKRMKDLLDGKAKF